MCKLLFFSCVGRPPVKTAFRNPNLSILHKYLQYIRLRFILFLQVLRLHAGIDLRGQVDRAFSKVNNISELVQRLLRRKRRRTVVVGSRESPPPKSIFINLIERSATRHDDATNDSTNKNRKEKLQWLTGLGMDDRCKNIWEFSGL